VKLVTRETAEGLELANRVVVEVSTASFRTVRGYSICGLIADELAFSVDSESSANPADEVISAIRPAMATMGPHATLLMMSSPHARRGPLWQAFSRYYGKEDAPVLVWKAATRTMNPSVPARVTDELFETDPARAAAEYGAEFRSDVETYVSREAVEACIIPNRYELAPVRGFRYFGFCDPSGGSADSMTLCICHREGDNVVVDALRERKPPFSPDDVVVEFAACLRSYFIGTVSGDRYAGEWPRERFAARGIRYEPCEQSKSDLYQALLPALNAKRVHLLDHARLISQLCSLERKKPRSATMPHPQPAICRRCRDGGAE
jgi:hypothetical protein